MNLTAIVRSLRKSLGLEASASKQYPDKDEQSSTYSGGTSTSTSSSIASSPFASEYENTLEEDSDRLPISVPQLNQSRHPYKEMIQQILYQVSELEHTFYEDQQQEFKLRMALERQSDRIQELHFSLDTEKQRNSRLVQLLRGIDSSGESEPEERMPSGSHVQSIGEIFESISPLLMQQRYDELSVSHRQSRRQLAKKEKAHRLLKCETEELQAKYDQLFDEYRNEQRRVETLCSRFLQIHSMKKKQIDNLKQSLGYASDCIYHAQVVIEACSHRIGSGTAKEPLHNFERTLGIFMDSLPNCDLHKLNEFQEQKKKEQELTSRTLTLALAGNTRKSEALSSSKQQYRRSYEN
ncbi:uncharacterized protein LOC108153172 [Drosophila miranda]|uniref:uncharacterized protein LOC108153172 n=1 Tax=Drosophila miranda TaxID=7229 RepID=UPI0007E615EE|nr:uncharacterized protein LOC108153172 [Drosophila miranda]